MNSAYIKMVAGMLEQFADDAKLPEEAGARVAAQMIRDLHKQVQDLEMQASYWKKAFDKVLNLTDK